jgi:hypothetical protein
MKLRDLVIFSLLALMVLVLWPLCAASMLFRDAAAKLRGKTMFQP